MALIAAYWRSCRSRLVTSSLRMLWRPGPRCGWTSRCPRHHAFLPQLHLGYLLSFGLLYAVDAYAAQHINISLTPFLSM